MESEKESSFCLGDLSHRAAGACQELGTAETRESSRTATSRLDGLYDEGKQTSHANISRMVHAGSFGTSTLVRLDRRVTSGPFRLYSGNRAGSSKMQLEVMNQLGAW